MRLGGFANGVASANDAIPADDSLRPRVSARLARWPNGQSLMRRFDGGLNLEVIGSGAFVAIVAAVVGAGSVGDYVSPSDGLPWR